MLHLGSEVYDIYSTFNGRPSAAVTLKQLMVVMLVMLLLK